MQAVLMLKKTNVKVLTLIDSCLFASVLHFHTDLPRGQSDIYWKQSQTMYSLLLRKQPPPPPQVPSRTL